MEFPGYRNFGIVRNTNQFQAKLRMNTEGVRAGSWIALPSGEIPWIVIGKECRCMGWGCWHTPVLGGPGAEGEMGAHLMGVPVHKSLCREMEHTLLSKSAPGIFKMCKNIGG